MWINDRHFKRETSYLHLRILCTPSVSSEGEGSPIIWLVPLPSRAISHARGHLRTTRVLLDGLQKQERLLVV